MTNIEQITHCLQQVVRFSDMLANNDPSRHRDAVVAQLAFNWGRYCELVECDGKANWQLLEQRLIYGEYKEMRDHADQLLTEVYRHM